jgi:hypothetical protein
MCAMQPPAQHRAQRDGLSHYFIWEDFCNEGSSKLEMSMCKVEEALQVLDGSY